MLYSELDQPSLLVLDPRRGYVMVVLLCLGPPTTFPISLQTVVFPPNCRISPYLASNCRLSPPISLQTFPYLTPNCHLPPPLSIYLSLSLSYSSDLFFTQGDTKIIYRRKMDGTSETSVSICDRVRNCTLHGYPTIVRIVSLSIDFDPSPMFRDKLVWSYWSGTETVTVGYDLGGADSDPHLIRLISPPAISSSLYFNQSLYYSKENSEKIDKWFDNGGTHDVFSLTGIEGSEFTFLDFSIVHPRTQPGECRHGNVIGSVF